jgi:hypothetical protein
MMVRRLLKSRSTPAVSYPIASIIEASVRGLETGSSATIVGQEQGTA